LLLKCAIASLSGSSVGPTLFLALKEGQIPWMISDHVKIWIAPHPGELCFTEVWHAPVEDVESAVGLSDFQEKARDVIQRLMVAWIELDRSIGPLDGSILLPEGP
jgi:hypothetical protein